MCLDYNPSSLGCEEGRCGRAASVPIEIRGLPPWRRNKGIVRVESPALGIRQLIRTLSSMGLRLRSFTTGLDQAVLVGMKLFHLSDYSDIFSAIKSRE